MNLLVAGKDKTPILEHLPTSYLIIDDGDLIDSIHFKRKPVRFEVAKHSFDPFKNLDYLRAREFIEILNAVFPEGENTLTKKTSNFVLLNALLSQPKSLTKLIPRATKDPGQLDAYQKIQTLLLSPVLKRVLCGSRDFIIDDSRPLIVRLNRAELGDFDCYVLANLLIGQYKGQVIIPDFGFYSAPFHTQLIRQNRLIAGVNYLSESELENDLLLIEEKIASRCLAKDAEVLAQYRGLLPHTVEYNDFVTDSIE